MRKLLSMLLCVVMILGLATSAYAGTVTACVGAQPETLDPAMNSAVDGSNYIKHLFEGLLRYAWDGSGIEFGQAASYEISEDGMTWTFTLRDDIVWSDGVPVVAGDFEYAWKRLVDPATAAPYGGDFGGFILNGGAIYEGNMEPETLGVAALDDKTLEVKLQNPCGFFDEIMTFPVFYPIRKDIIDANGDAWATSVDTLVSNGAYTLGTYTMDEEIIMVPNPYYYDTAKLVATEIVFKLIADPNAILAAVRMGELMYGGTYPADEYDAVIAEGLLKIDPALGTYYVNFNNTFAPLDNVLVRKALSLAVDTEYLSDVVTRGVYFPADNFVGPGFPDSDGADFYDFQKVIDRSDYEANKLLAQAALAEAGYPNGEGFPTLEYGTNLAGYHPATFEALASMWKEVLNVNVVMANVEWSVFLGMRRAHQHQIARDGWIADYGDASNLLNLFYSTSGNNSTAYNNAAFDAFMSTAMETTDASVRYPAMHEAEMLAVGTEYVVIPVYYYSASYITNAALKGLVTYPMGERFFFLATAE